MTWVKGLRCNIWWRAEGEWGGRSATAKITSLKRQNHIKNDIFWTFVWCELYQRDRRACCGCSSSSSFFSFLNRRKNTTFDPPLQLLRCTDGKQSQPLLAKNTKKLQHFSSNKTYNYTIQLWQVFLPFDVILYQSPSSCKESVGWSSAGSLSLRAGRGWGVWCPTDGRLRSAHTHTNARNHTKMAGRERTRPCMIFPV